MEPVNIAIIGGGGRGTGYASYAEAHPEQAKIVGVAEPRDFYRNRLVEKHGIPEGDTFSDWRQAAEREKFADAVIIATQDAMHVEPTEAFAAKGYHILLEKPMAPTAEGCRRIYEAVNRADILFAVCHVMRYTGYTQKLKSLIDSGLIGDVVSIQHLEPVGYWHQAHSFVRGNWRNERESSFMLLAKSCHDLDWLRYIVGSSCEKVSSFGSLKHFCTEGKPAAAGEAVRCLDCAYEADCPYSASKIYLGRVDQGQTGWPVDVLTSDLTREGVTDALRSGPYGRCVYECDNDVVDNQVVNMLFEGGQTCSFTMTGLSEMGHRKTTLFGTRGQIFGDGRYLRRFDFLSEETETIDTEAADSSILGGHGGGDYSLMKSFVEAVAHQDQTRVLSGPEETLETHLMVFAAETARRDNCVVTM